MATINLEGPGGPSFILSPSDLTAASECEYGWLRKIDGRLGRAEVLDDADAFLERIARLGDAHEARYLDELKSKHQVTELDRPHPYNAETLAVAAEKTKQALLAGHPVVFQGVVFDGQFGGMADFFIKNSSDQYVVVDAKLARKAKTTAVMQIAAYADLLDNISIPRASEGVLYLGNQNEFRVDVDDAIGIYRLRRSHLEQLLTRHLAQSEAAKWTDDTLLVCGKCVHCEAAIEENDDLLQVAGITKAQRLKLHSAGIRTLKEFAESTKNESEIPNRTWEKLSAQAKLQSDPSLGIDVFSIDTLNTIPEPNSGDIFFDFEGDPMWTDETGVAEGLEYLFGFVDTKDEFTALWAHNREEERNALIEFFELVKKRWEEHPDFHIYHYASYEVTALKKLTVRHSYGEDFLDDLLRNRIFVDLYSIVRQSLRLPVKSYSIKKLEPFYMGDDLRSEDGVTNATDSMVQYLAFEEQSSAGNTAEAQKILDDIADYNKYDCISTARLRDWLLGHIPKDARVITETAVNEPSEHLAELAVLAVLADQVMEGIPLTNRTKTEQAIAMIAASIGYHRREDKPFWWAYFDRLISDVEDWQHPRDTLIANGPVVATTSWTPTPRSGKYKRTIEMTGQLEPGHTLKPGTKVYSVYESFPTSVVRPMGAVRIFSDATGEVIEVSTDESGNDVVTFTEVLNEPAGFAGLLPMAIFSFNFFSATVIEKALISFAESIVGTKVLPNDPAADLLSLRPPNLKSGTFDGTVRNGDYLNPLVTTLQNLNASYVAVQGPPGTGKTYIGSRAVARLLADGWRIGVVAQSHKTVENFLHKALEAGVNPSRIAKVPKSGSSGGPWTNLKSVGELGTFISENSGVLVGGTAWNFSNTQVRDLDLLVIDEAGQFSLAHTIATSRSAKRLLLLGDPQQLPQVTQGSHPEPVERSALSWLAQNYDTIPSTHGFFLERTWRMHSALAQKVSALSYNSLLYSEAHVTDKRELQEIEPGLHAIEVVHSGNSISSIEEACEVVKIVANVMTKTWKSEPNAKPRRMNHQDVIIVAPYNAQVAMLRKHLDKAGYDKVRVGTVDMFQGQEAAVAIVSLAASSDVDVSRGLEFLLNRNRLNVAISRGQWASYIVYSPGLKHSIPSSVEKMLQIGAFIRLVN